MSQVIELGSSAGVGGYSIDPAPVSGSPKAVQSGGVFTALQNEAQARESADQALADQIAGLGTGGGGSSELILQSADGTNWLVRVTDLGALTTEETESEGSDSIVLIASNDIQWILTINNSGVLVTTEV